MVGGGPEATTAAVEATPESAATAAKEGPEESQGAERVVAGVNQRTDEHGVVLEEMAATEAAQEVSVRVRC